MNRIGRRTLRLLKEIDASLYPITYLLVWPINQLMLSVFRGRLRRAGADPSGTFRNGHGPEKSATSSEQTAWEEESSGRPLRIAHVSLLLCRRDYPECLAVLGLRSKWGALRKTRIEGFEVLTTSDGSTEIPFLL